MKTFEIYKDGIYIFRISAETKNEIKEYVFNLHKKSIIKFIEIKKYKLIYLDKYKNELKNEIIECDNIKEARKYSIDICFNSMLNDLNKVIVKKVY